MKGHSIALTIAACGMALLLCVAPILLTHCIRPCCADQAPDCCAANASAATESDTASLGKARRLADPGDALIALHPAADAVAFDSVASDGDRSRRLGAPPGRPARLVILQI